MPQHNSQMQYGIQQFNTGQYQQLFPVNNPQNTFMMPNPSQMQHVNTSDGPARGHTEEEKEEKMKAQLRKRKIPEENWRYYLQAPEHWDFEDITEIGLQRDIEATLMYGNAMLGRKRICGHICETKDEAKNNRTSNGRNRQICRRRYAG